MSKVLNLPLINNIMQKPLVCMIVLLLLPISLAEMSPSAEETAKIDLRSLYRADGIYAGANQFSDYWARDSLFATLGSNAIGDYDVSKRQLELFIENQNNKGQIPMRYGDYDITLKLLGVPISQSQRARYEQDKLFSNPRDQNCLFVIAAEDYVMKSKDTKFARDNFQSFEKAINWLAEKDDNGNFLINEGNYAGWTDSVKKNGEVLYTNACFYRALRSMSVLSREIGNEPEAQLYDLWSQLVRKRINEHFWLKQGYYSDWIKGDTKYTYFSTDGNVLAVVWGVADEDQAQSILAHMENEKIYEGFGVKTTYPKYKKSLISPVNLIAGISDYHTDMRWLWVSCFYVKALQDQGHLDRADSELAEIKAAIVEHGEVYEVYESDSSPVDRFFYKSEHPFAWSAGVCTYVFQYQ